ncbi:MAG: MlaE family lipid ABC transporter permease subunit [Alphaproteobacteria bacterium]|nr:MlaE family lipid ABC transporter permease subunit [Alphaproteobacteria bacterium]MDX5369530.1 MlaE family lipid ABC transporter permease subunit [Alphaproteobacteria bacterium]MDX5464188.1 MlaE family lipid ABC transporter permease subunit [Alphaproteobacteria bacterium]
MSRPARPEATPRGDGRIALAGDWTMATLADAERALGAVHAARDRGPVTLDVSGLGRLDTGGAYLLRRLEAERGVGIDGASEGQRRLLDLVEAAEVRTERPRPPGALVRTVTMLGARVAGEIADSRDLVAFFGLALARLGRMLIAPRRFRFTSLVHHMQEAGLAAVPIVSLISFLIGVVIAYMGSVQLRAFGAEVFVVNLIAIAVLRELGILLTAIVIAGRSGSAFTAAIGSMKVREEVDAMRVIGLDPMEVLVLPRVLALVLMLPVLGVIADVVGLIGGGLMSWISLGISPGMFLTRLHETTDVWHYAVGLIKAPFFAMIVGIIGCYQGFQVSGSAESVGRLTTQSVVRAIFLVIVADALFAILFVELNI